MDKKQSGQPALIKFSHTNLLSAQGGSIVSSRRQFKVSKEKFNGVSWVNASGQESSSGSGNPSNNGRPPNSSGQRRRAGTRRRTAPEPAAAATRTTTAATAAELAGRRELPPEDGDGQGAVVGLPAPGIRKAYQALSEYYGHTATTPTTVDKGLAPWTTIKFPIQLPDRYKELLWTTFAEAPPRQYQFDRYGILTHNPCIGNEGFVWTLNDPTRIQFCATMGVVFQCMNRGNLNAPDLAALVGRLCAHINNKLQNWSGDFLFYNDTISCITVLATLAVYKREFSQWAGHMKAVAHIVQNNGGSPTLLPPVKGAIAQVDLAGSLSTAADPFIPMFRSASRPQIVLKPDAVDNIYRVLRTTLSACGFDATTMSNIIDVAIFSANWSAARRLRSPVFHPDVLIDEFLYLQHAIIKEPHSVWLPPSTTTSSTHSSPSSDQEIQPYTTTNTAIPLRQQQQQQQNSEQQQQQQQQQQSPPPPPTIPDPLLTQSLHQALRLAILLFLREPAIDPVMDASAYSPVLQHIYQHLRILYSGILERRRSGRNNNNKDKDKPSFSPTSARPLILWICLLSDTIRSANNIRIPLPDSFSSFSSSFSSTYDDGKGSSSYPFISSSSSSLSPPPNNNNHNNNHPTTTTIPGDASHILRDLVRLVLGLDDDAGDSSSYYSQQILLSKRDREILGGVLDIRSLRGDSWDWAIALGRLVVSSDDDARWDDDPKGEGGCGTRAKARSRRTGEGGEGEEEEEEDTDVGWLCTIP